MKQKTYIYMYTPVDQIDTDLQSVTQDNYRANPLKQGTGALVADT